MSSDLRVTSHVDDRRWLQRSDDPVMDPVDAWSHGDSIRGHGLDGDEVRYHEHTGTLLIRHGHRLVTVIDERNLQSQARHAVQLVRSEADGGGDD